MFFGVPLVLVKHMAVVIMHTSKEVREQVLKKTPASGSGASFDRNVADHNHPVLFLIPGRARPRRSSSHSAVLRRSAWLLAGGEESILPSRFFRTKHLQPSLKLWSSSPSWQATHPRLSLRIKMLRTRWRALQVAGFGSLMCSGSKCYA